MVNSNNPLPIGTRVVAVSHNEGNTLFVFGRGVFEGYFLPDAIDVTKQVAEIREQYAIQRTVTPNLPEEFTEQDAFTALLLSESNPRIKLDSGETVWGYECWWNDEAIFDKKSEGYEIVAANLQESRDAAAKMFAMEQQFRAVIEGVSKGN